MPPSAKPDSHINDTLSKVTSFEGVTVSKTDHVASLWANYGKIRRLHLRPPSDSSSETPIPRTLILKTISPPPIRHSSDEGHKRKVLSYGVEKWFYEHLASRLDAQSDSIKVARCFVPVTSHPNEPLELLLEDLSPEFPVSSYGSCDASETRCVLNWLAGFHATFWGIHQRKDEHIPLVPPPALVVDDTVHSGIWEQGTYWYLDTRREELEEVGNKYDWLLRWTEKVNAAIKSEASEWGTLLHGDVKGANIFFTPHSTRRRPSQTDADEPLRCALYDFQYVGIGLCTRDLVYFLGTTAEEKLLRKREDEVELLRFYHRALETALQQCEGATPQYPFDKFMMHWEMAIVDWYRFLVSWGMWGNDTWVERRAKEIVRDWERTNTVL